LYPTLLANSKLEKEVGIKYKVLTVLMVVLLLVTSVLFGCNEGQTLVIPSSMSPYEVFNETANAGPHIGLWPYFQEEWSAEYMDPYAMPEGATEEQFDEGFNAYLPESLYIKRDKEQAGFRVSGIVSYIAVLKYGDTQSTERSFISISETQEFQNLTYGGITLKNGTHTLDPWWEQYDYWEESTMPCYLIHSGCFILYFFGRDDVTKDALDRIIVAFGVESSSNQTQAGNTT
jgi:hypothetical protein